VKNGKTYKYFLLAIDVFSHKVWTCKLSNKQAENVWEELESILASANIPLATTLESDKGRVPACEGRHFCPNMLKHLRSSSFLSPLRGNSTYTLGKEFTVAAKEIRQAGGQWNYKGSF